MSMGTVVQLRPSQSVLPTVRGGRKPNAAFRSREYLTEAEIEQLRKAARKNRNPVRDELLVLLAFRHALRVSELVSLTVEQFDLKAATVHTPSKMAGSTSNRMHSSFPAISVSLIFTGGAAPPTAVGARGLLTVRRSWPDRPPARPIRWLGLRHLAARKHRMRGNYCVTSRYHSAASVRISRIMCR
jgi:hypothetical protein